MATVAFYGAGMLGSAMVRAMLRRGFEVHVWNRTLARAQELEAAGARAFSDPAETARGADIVHCCLHDDASVDAVLEAALPGIDPSTRRSSITPPSCRNASSSAKPGSRAPVTTFVHAPVFMGPPMALETPPA